MADLGPPAGARLIPAARRRKSPRQTVEPAEEVPSAGGDHVADGGAHVLGTAVPGAAAQNTGF